MDIELSEIPESGLELTVDGDGWFPDDVGEKLTPVQASFIVKKKGRRYFLTGKLDTDISLQCDRCLENFSYHLQTEFSDIFELSMDHRSSTDEYACTANEMDISVLTEPVISIADVLQEQVYLAMPISNVCSDTCRGLCPRCGVNLNKEKCQCQEEHSSSFQILRSINQ